MQLHSFLTFSGAEAALPGQRTGYQEGDAGKYCAGSRNSLSKTLPDVHYLLSSLL
jgi:hypothetical protein